MQLRTHFNDSAINLETLTIPEICTVSGPLMNRNTL